MKSATCKLLALAAVLLLVCGSPVHAQNNPLITVNENGMGTILFPGGSPTPTAGVLAPDPGPGGLPLALTYNLLGPPGLVAGDVIISELGGVSSDVIRFNPAGTGGIPGYPASLVYYSDNDERIADAIADTGLPTANYTNVVMLTEATATLTYTPTSTQPGFVPGFGVTYSIVGDVEAVPGVPEPSSLVLLGLGAVGLAGYGYRRRQQV